MKSIKQRLKALEAIIAPAWTPDYPPLAPTEIEDIARKQVNSNGNRRRRTGQTVRAVVDADLHECIGGHPTRARAGGAREHRADIVQRLLRPAEGPAATVVPAAEVPPPYHGLLVHSEHMTVTVEEFHGGLVDVQVLDSRRAGESYARTQLPVGVLTGLMGGPFFLLLLWNLRRRDATAGEVP